MFYACNFCVSIRTSTKNIPVEVGSSSTSGLAEISVKIDDWWSLLRAECM
jgi:hypothetical protein